MTADGLLVFLIAGEPSGDLLGARLMTALKRQDRRVRFAGIGGEWMAAEGLDSRFPVTELALMGLVEILPHLPRLLRRIDETAAAVRELRPDVVVTIDSPSFSLRVAKRLQGTGIPLVHYVAPSVWAWRPGRARKVAGFLDHMLALLPFEPPYFERHGLPCSYVGHPVLETRFGAGDGARFRRDHGLPAEGPLVCVLPGSRRGEVRRLLPVFGQALALLASRHAGLRAVLPTVATVAEPARAAARQWPVPTLVLEEHDGKPDAFAAANVALAASGTVVLELAAAGVPTVVAYRANALTAMMVRRLVTVRHASLVNLLLDRAAIPEYLQEACTADRLAGAVDRLLTNRSARDGQRRSFAEVMAKLTVAERPSDRAAKVVLDVIARGKRD